MLNLKILASYYLYIQLKLCAISSLEEWLLCPPSVCVCQTGWDLNKVILCIGQNFIITSLIS